MYRVVLFDLDHTLLDSDASERLAFGATVESIGLERSESLLATYTSINRAMWRAVERGEMTPGEVKIRRFEDFLAAVEVDADPGVLAVRYAEELGGHGELYPGALELLDAAASVAVLGLVTNGLGEVQRARLRRLDLEHRFAAVSISGELGVAKPDPAIFVHTFDQLGTGSEGAVMVGDNLSSDIAGGIAAGIDTIWFNPGGAPATDVVPTHVATTLNEIATILTT